MVQHIIPASCINTSKERNVRTCYILNYRAQQSIRLFYFRAVLIRQVLQTLYPRSLRKRRSCRAVTNVSSCQENAVC